MVFTSSHPGITYPEHLTLWHWLFDSEHSILRKQPPQKIAGWTNTGTGERLTYTEAKVHATHLSTALVKRYGLRPGETVALFSPNTVWYPVALFSALRAGGVVSGASPAYNADEMAYALKTASAKMIFTVPQSLEVARAAAEKVGLPKDKILLLEGTVSGYVGMEELLSIGQSYGDAGQASAFTLSPGQTNRNLLGFLSFSSGTTGLPKAVMISHANVMAQAQQVSAFSPWYFHKVLAVPPLFHITGLIHFICHPPSAGVDVYMMPAFSLEAMLMAAVTYQINSWNIVPPILVLLSRVPESLLTKYDLRFVKRIGSGAAPLSDQVVQEVARRIPSAAIQQGYGMTETASCLVMCEPSLQDSKYGRFAGHVCPSTTLKIVDVTTGKELGVDEEGEIWAKGPQITMGYLNNEKATRETYGEDGYLRTGDIGLINKDRLLLITDRLKELIKVKGIQVAPAELEDLLLGHDLIVDCALVAIKDDYAGEKPKAFVVFKGGSSRSKEELEADCKQVIQFVKERKDRSKWVVEVEVIDAIPKSASGKILRRMLKDRPAKEQGFSYRDTQERARL